MKNNVVHIADFYHQLAVLTKAGLPLPESLQQLSRGMSGRKLPEAIRRVGDQVAKGRTLSDALTDYPGAFPAFHRQVIAAGASGGTLPQALFAVANYAYFSYYLRCRFRQAFLYPVITVMSAVALFILINVAILPEFAQMFDQMIPGEPLPGLTHLALMVSDFFVRWQAPIAVAFAAALLYLCWLFTGTASANRAMSRLIGVLPGSWHVTQSVDAARLSALLSVFLNQKMAATDALETAAMMVESDKIRQALQRVAAAHAAGKGLVPAMEREPAIERLITFTVKQSPENELAQELERLSTLYERRVMLATRSFLDFWGILALVMMGLSVGGVILAVFLPLIKLVDKLGG